MRHAIDTGCRRSPRNALGRVNPADGRAGVPLMRPMAMEFPDDPAGFAFDLQYCLGRELLVSPVVSPDGWVTTHLPPGRWMDWWSGAVRQGSLTLRRQVPLRELPLYLRENSLLVLGPVRSHVAEGPADPLTVEAFVTNEAVFALRTDAVQVDFRCRRDPRGVSFEASRPSATLVLRLHDIDPPTAATADGQPLSRLEPARLHEVDRGWAVDGRTTILKARARDFRAS